MAKQQKTRGRSWWPTYFATLAKSGNERIACKAAGVHGGKVREACARWPQFEARRREALQAGTMAQAARVPGRAPGRPALVYSAPLLDSLLDAYAETGSAESAAAWHGVSVTALRNRRRRDPVFAGRWLAARARAAWFESELGPWWRREVALHRAFASGLPLADAARVARVSESLARVIATHRPLTASQSRKLARARFEALATPTRFDVAPPGARPARVRAAPIVRHHASVAEREALERGAKAAADEKRLTGEMRAFLDLIKDDRMSVAQACDAMGRTPREVEAWARANAYFAGCLD